MKDKDHNEYTCMALLNSRPVSHILRTLNLLLLFDQAYIGLTPLPYMNKENINLLSELAYSSYTIKLKVLSTDYIENDMVYIPKEGVFIKRVYKYFNNYGNCSIIASYYWRFYRE